MLEAHRAATKPFSISSSRAAVRMAHGGRARFLAGRCGPGRWVLNSMLGVRVAEFASDAIIRNASYRCFGDQE